MLSQYVGKITVLVGMLTLVLVISALLGAMVS